VPLTGFKITPDRKSIHYESDEPITAVLDTIQIAEGVFLGTLNIYIVHQVRIRCNRHVVE